MILPQTYGGRSALVEEQVFYDHFLALVGKEDPEQLIERIKLLFVDGIGYPDPRVSGVLTELLSSNTAPVQFYYILNRCLHILINRWQLSDRNSLSIPKLIYLFKDRPIYKGGSLYRSRALARLHQLIGEFSRSDQYVTLQRLAQVIEQRQVTPENLGSQPLEVLIPRYPYLYDHCLIGDVTDSEHQHTIYQLKQEKQRQFERDLSGYVTHHMRRNALLRRGNHDPQTIEQLLGTTSNPTLLSGSDVASALKFYGGKVQGKYSHRDMAQRFSIHTETVKNFGQFKQEFYSYIVMSVDANYGNRRFNRQLSDHLASFLPDQDNSPISDLLVVRTCSQVLNFLVVESPKRVEHFTFIDLLGNVGPMVTTGVLLKVVLFCKKVKPYLEKRLGILFNHYGKHTNDNVLWLVKSLENINLALTTNFGSLSLPFS